MSIEVISIKTGKKDELVDITGDVERIVRQSGVKDGFCVIFTPHTTAAITINENADPTVMTDIVFGLDGLNFEKISFRHSEGNSPSHLKSSLIGCSEAVIIEDGRLYLGTWQGIFFCEFDGPRQRKAVVKIIGK